MADFYDYWLGFEKAELDEDTIDRKWGQRGTPYYGASIKFCNNCFEMFYRARQTIDFLPSPYSSRMKKKLEEAATEGWSVTGVADMKQAFQHLADTGGVWKDGRTANYYGGKDKAFAKSSFIKAPDSIVNFANEVEPMVKKVLKGVDFQEEKIGELAEAGDDWEVIGNVLGEINGKGEKIAPFLWTMPEYQKRVQTAVTFSGALSKIWTGMNMYGKVGMAHGGDATAQALLRTAVTFVPVLGDFYGAAIEAIPGMEAKMQAIMNRHHRMLEDASRGVVRPHYAR